MRYSLIDCVSLLADNCGLLQALDLLPDDVLHELLQEKTGSRSNGVSTAPPPPVFTPSLANGSPGATTKQTPMAVCNSASDSEASSSTHSEYYTPQQAPGKRQRNSITSLGAPRGSDSHTLSRARSIQLQPGRLLQDDEHHPPPNAQPSASQLLFVSGFRGYSNEICMPVT